MIELGDLLEAMAPAGARLIGEPAATRFDGFAYDSRKVNPGEIFLAVRTARADGHEFIPDAVGRGASGVIGDRLTTASISGVTTVAVEDTMLALRAWARYVLARYAPDVIAVVGSVGKTTAAKAIVGVLGHGLPEDPAVFDSDNHNTLYGLPIALGQLAPTHGTAVLELAGEAPGDLRALAELTRPRIIVVTRGFTDRSSMDELRDLIAGLPSNGLCVMNADDPCLAALAMSSRAPVLRYGAAPGADVRAEAVNVQLSQTCFRLVLPERASQIRLAGLGRPAVEGALAGAALGLAQGFDPDEIAASLERLRPLPGRLNPLPGANGSLVLDDSFEASPLALAAGLDILERAAGRKIVVLGELAGGEPREAVHRQIGETIARRADRLITLGAAGEAAGLAALASGMAANTVVMTEGVADAAAAVRRQLGTGDVVLVAGGAEARLERVVERLLADPGSAPEVLVRQDPGWKKRVFLSQERPTWVEVDLGAIGQNVARLKELASPAALLAVLKADAYGHGALRVARTALLHGADYLATACVSEAVTLRRHGIAAPILILGFTPAWQAQEIVRHHLTATVFNLEPVRYLARAVHTLGQGPARVHIKVDTGMGRLGLLPAEVPDFVDAVRQMPGVEIEGIFTHFARADDADRAPTLNQIARFDAMLDALKARGGLPRFVHAANTAGIFAFPEARYSMVRSGIGIYGLDPSDAVPCPAGFLPALTFKTLVAQLKELPPGSPISYGGTFVTSRPSRIAVLPVGYGDGFRRSPRNWKDVLIRGRRAPIVGVVCMDMCMIDVTDVPEAREGDEVVLIGRQGSDEVSVADVARNLGTIPYEVVTQILARVPREVPPGP